MPPRGVQKGSKRARQYEHIKESQLERGAPEPRSDEIAARRSRMNKAQLQRAVDGRKRHG